MLLKLVDSPDGSECLGSARFSAWLPTPSSGLRVGLESTGPECTALLNRGTRLRPLRYGCACTRRESSDLSSP